MDILKALKELSRRKVQETNKPARMADHQAIQRRALFLAKTADTEGQNLLEHLSISQKATAPISVKEVRKHIERCENITLSNPQAGFIKLTLLRLGARMHRTLKDRQFINVTLNPCKKV